MGRVKFDGPRASPAVTDGKVVTFGVTSTLSCLDAGDRQQNLAEGEPG